MTTSPVREQIESKLEALSEDQLHEILQYIEVMESSRLPKDYDEDNDPTVAFFSASPDYASRSKEILRAEFGHKRPLETKDSE